jgi:hypothetical protein
VQEFEICIPLGAGVSELQSLVESASCAEGLQMTMAGSLAKHPGSVHWHFKKHGERGTLEITWSPRDQRLWASVQAGRRAEWIEPCVLRIKARIEDSLRDG